MNLSKFSVKRPVTITMFVLIVVLIGIISLTELPIDLFPEIEVPVAVVATNYSGTGPQEMENLITKPLEGAIATVGNIENISSISSEGSSIVIAQFGFGVDMDLATLEMREKVDLVKGFLPDQSGEPLVIKIDPNALPVYQLSLSTKGDLAGLQTLTEDTISQRFERLDGVASVDILGGFGREIEIAVNPNELANLGLNINGLSQIISSSNLNLPGGSVKNGQQEYSVRITGEFSDLEEIRDMAIPLNSGEVLKLSDIAKVNLVRKDLSAISRTNGKDSINLSMQKQSGRNTVQVSNLINKEVKKLIKDYPDIEFDIVLDSAEFITKSINTVVKNTLFGSLLAILILYIFLKNIRTTLIIGISIPISLIASFILLYFNGITLNILALGGLALAVGLLVDSAIVVLENIFRFNAEGYSRSDAAILGASEVGMAITASTLTTVAVFIPIVFVEGVVGTIFRDFAITVTLSLAASLVISLTLIPMLASKIMRVDSKEEKLEDRKLSKVYIFFDNAYLKLEGWYKKVLIASLAKRRRTMITAIAIFLISIVSLATVGVEFLPATDEGNLIIDVGVPPTTSIEKTDKAVMNVETLLAGIDEVETISTNINGGNMMMSGRPVGNGGSISVVLSPLSERKRSTSQIAEEVRGMLKDIPGVDISVSQPSNTAAIGSANPISISIKGSELSVLEEISDDIKEILESVEGTREVTTSLSDSVPEIEVKVKKDIAASYGLTPAVVANNVRNSGAGTTVTRLKTGGDEIDVVIRDSSDITESLNNFRYMDISTPMGTNIPLSQLADINLVTGPRAINRDNQERQVTVTSAIMDRELNEILKDVRAKLANYEVPGGYTYTLGGENEEIVDAFKQLALALVLAIILIYMVMAAQFESLLYPFIIMFTIPLAFGGGALGLFLSRRPLGVTGLIGVIILSGIVVNNGIVLIDYINTLRKQGKDRYDAIVAAGPVRLRPILMTTLTTILGLIPLSLGIGEGAELIAPIGSVVIGGLSLATILTLVVVPVMYTLLDDLSIKTKKRFLKKDTKASEVE